VNQLNSDFLERVALAFGDNTQFPAAQLIEGLLPVAQVELYRRKFILFNDTLPVLVTSVSIKLGYIVPEGMSWRVFLAEVVNGDTGGAVRVVASISLRPAASLIIVPLNARVPPGASEPVIGLMQANQKDPFDDQRPSSIWVPRESEFVIKIEPEGATFTMATNIQFRMMIIEEPVEKSFSGGKADSAQVS